MTAFEQLREEDPLSFRALTLAARAAHIGNREGDAVSLFRRAEAIAASDAQRREARWGLLSSLSQIESDEAWAVLALLRGDNLRHVPQEIVRDATRCLLMEMRSGAIRSLAWARHASEVVDDVRDPIARCSFRNVYAGVLSLHGEYALALEVGRRLYEDAQGHRLNFVLPVASCTMAQALCGLRRYEEAEGLLAVALEEGVRTRDTLLEPLAAALLVRVRCQDRRLGAALSVTCDLHEAVVSVKGEFLASRALALTCAGRHDEAGELIAQAVAVTDAIEARVLDAAVRAVISIRTKARDTGNVCAQLIDVVEESNGYDLLVASYRTSSELAAVLLGNVELHHRVTSVMRQVDDAAILEAAGANIIDDGDPPSLLSKREFEVYELLCAGLSNRQIGECLYISEETVKAHAHHIFDKLGIRSRHALAIDAARRRTDHPSETR
jgi:DNA-binding NarL/FixJ family response regulator